MEADVLRDIIKSGESSKVQFKQDFDHQDRIAAEVIAMSNATGGMLIFGVADKTGEIIGLEYDRLQFISNRMANIATDLVKPQVYIVSEVVAISDDKDDIYRNFEKKVLVVYISEGTGKPYKDTNGTIWMKQGADKRKVSDNNEILRLFQQSGMTFVDNMVINDTCVSDVDEKKVSEYIKRVCPNTDEYDNISNEILYQNLFVMKNDKVTLGGVLFFYREPQKYCPVFCVKAVAFYGNSMGGLHYRDSRDITGVIPELFHQSMQFSKTKRRDYKNEKTIINV